jgi:hypothetical protein
MAAVGKRIKVRGIIRSKSGRQDHGSHPDFYNPCLFFQIHGPGWAEFLASLAPPPFLEIDAVS